MGSAELVGMTPVLDGRRTRRWRGKAVLGAGETAREELTRKDMIIFRSSLTKRMIPHLDKLPRSAKANGASLGAC
jgi:hypothetical protein